MDASPPKLSLMTGGREAVERSLVRIAATGTSEELRAALRRLALRGALYEVPLPGTSALADIPEADGTPKK
jgi:hypothetical protein